MSSQNIQVYRYRWIVLFLFFFVNVVSNMLWTTYAPVTSLAMEFYGVDEFSIILISLMFLIIYIPITFLASWLIDKYDFKVGARIGAIFMGIFGFLRYIADNNYTLALIFSIGIAIAQPFLLNTITKLSANWFPDKERTTATGISLIATSIGIALGMIAGYILYDIILMDIIREDREPLLQGDYIPEGNVEGAFVFKNVCFEYDDGDSPVLENISFSCSPGQSVALLGSTGSGKTTLVNLLPRFYECSSGSIQLDNVELSHYPRKYLRSQIGIVEQEPFLFSRSIRENISYGVGREVTQKEVENAARAAAIHDVIQAFPKSP